MAKTLHQLYLEANERHRQAHNTKNQELLRQVFHQYNNLLNQAPNEPSILFETATVALQLGFNGMAIALLRYTLQNTPPQKQQDKAAAYIWNNLGSAYKAEHMDAEAEQAWLKAIELMDNEDMLSAYYNNLSTLYINQGKPEAGLAFADKAVELDLGNPHAHWNRGLLLLESGQWAEGLKEYDYGLLTHDRIPRNYAEDPHAVPMWRGEDLTDKTIVVYGEQGLGDEIMFLEAVNDLIKLAGKVIIECHERLETAVRRSFPMATVYPTRKSATIDWPRQHHLDYKVPMGSLFQRLRADGYFSKTPYLQVDTDKVAQLRKRLAIAGKGPYIGIAYEAGAKKTHGHERSFKLTPLKPILELPATFISLQYTPGAREKFANFERDTGIKVHHWPDVVEAWLDEDCKDKSPGFDYDWTLALLHALDYVVIPCTAVAHACGAIGHDALVLTPDACAWRYLGEPESMRFYHNGVKLIRQEADWERAIRLVVTNLREQMGCGPNN